MAPYYNLNKRLHTNVNAATYSQKEYYWFIKVSNIGFYL